MTVPEIEQGLTDAAESKVTISFTPHLMCMVSTIMHTLLFANSIFYVLFKIESLYLLVFNRNVGCNLLFMLNWLLE
jgi:N-acetyl-gamma-glutamylphosphate reductase